MKQLLLILLALNSFTLIGQIERSTEFPQKDVHAGEKILNWHKEEAPHFRPTHSSQPSPEFTSFRNLEDLRNFPPDQAEKVLDLYLTVGTSAGKEILDEIVPLRKFKNLQYLAIGNSTYAPYDFEGLLKLKTIKFENSRTLLEFPSSLGKALNLEALIIERANKASKLPESLYDLKNLRTLKITGFKAEGDSLSTKIRNFQQLEYLEFTHCNINVPEEVGELKMLKELRIRNYFNLNVPTEKIYQLPNLEVLGLYIYKDEHHIGIGQLKNLKVLHLNSDSIFKELGDLEKLEGLALIHNKNQVYPDELAKLSNLEVLLIDNNRVISEAPKFIPKLNNLRHLTFNGCQKLKTFDKSYAEMKKVESIKLHYNSLIIEIPDHLQRFADIVELKNWN